MNSKVDIPAGSEVVGNGWGYVNLSLVFLFQIRFDRSLFTNLRHFLDNDGLTGGGKSVVKKFV